MTERTIRAMAKELAGIFYEDNRSPRFRKAFPTLKDYMRGLWHQPDGDILIKEPGWTHHIELARKLLTNMLGRPDGEVSTLMKERIYEALIEEHNKALIRNAKVVQHKNSEPLH
jgi:hypothetical protein